MRSGIDPAAVDPDVRPQDDLFAHVNGRLARDDADPRGPRPLRHLRRAARDRRGARARRSSRRSPPAPRSRAPSRPRSATSTRASWTRTRVEALGVRPARRRPRARSPRSRMPVTSSALTGRLGRAGVARARHPVRQHRRPRPEPLRRLPRAGRPGAARRVLLPRGAARRHAHGLRRARRADAGPRRLARPRRAPPTASWPSRPGSRPAHWDKVTNRDPVKTYTLVDLARAGRAGARRRLGALPRRASGAGARPSTPSSSASPTTSARWPPRSPRSRSRPGATGCAWHVVHAHAPYLSAAVVDENFDFYGRTLSGVPQIRERWKRGVEPRRGGARRGRRAALRRAALPAARQGAHGRARRQPRRGVPAQPVRSSPWMGDETRREALAKLEPFTPKIGYPDRWRDYSALEIVPGDLARQRPPRRRPSRSTASSPSSAARSTATSGS